MSYVKNSVGPDEALQLLTSGNARFAAGLRSIEPLLSSLKLKELARKGQKPFATILTCSDSRIPTETIFDQGVGDLFVIRLAGNIVTSFAIASMEFATLNFGTSLIVIMGHTHCGAIKAAISREMNGAIPSSAHLDRLVRRISPAVQDVLKAGPIEAGESLVKACTHRNVDHAVATLMKRSHALAGMAQQKQVQIVGAVYDIGSGRVNFTNCPAVSARAEEQIQAALKVAA